METATPRRIHGFYKLKIIIMKTQIIHHVNEDFTTEVIETITLRGGLVTSISFSETQKL